jgi:biotin carboxyl carrier protein
LFQAKVKDTEYKVDVISQSEVEVNGEVLSLDLATISKNKSHIILNNKSFNIEFVSRDEEKKLITIKVNNNPYTIQLKDKFDLLLSQLGMSNLTTKVVKEIKAPMPGLVISVLKSVGDTVKEGENVLILEAMKMENVIKSPIDGVIKSIIVSPSNTVEKNQILVEFE